MSPDSQAHPAGLFGFFSITNFKPLYSLDGSASGTSTGKADNDDL